MIYVCGAPTYRFIDNEEEGGRRRGKKKEEVKNCEGLATIQ